MSMDALAEGRKAAGPVIAAHGRSFAFAGRLLPEAVRLDAFVLYAWCRRADDAIDEAPDRATALEALGRLESELAAMARGEPPQEPVAAAFAELASRRRMPLDYPGELLRGMRMDLEETRYGDHATFDLYCWRAAGVVGLMMCHVMGVSDAAALRQAAHLGMAMQMTNVARDVAEDWNRGRLYLPDALLAPHGLSGLSSRLGEALPGEVRASVPPVVQSLLRRADAFYASGRDGLTALPWRCAVAIAAAAAIYRDIGRSLARQGFDPWRGRARTTTGRKVWLALGAVCGQLARLPMRWLRVRRHAPPRSTLQPADVVVP
jgi:phytoene synthase